MGGEECPAEPWTPANRRAVDALRVPFYSPSHPRGHMFRKISLIWEIPAKTDHFANGLVVGTPVGAAVGLLVAPQPGRQTRNLIRRKTGGSAGSLRERFRRNGAVSPTAVKRGAFTCQKWQVGTRLGGSNATLQGPKIGVYDNGTPAP